MFAFTRGKGVIGKGKRQDWGCLPGTSPAVKLCFVFCVRYQCYFYFSARLDDVQPCRHVRFVYLSAKLFPGNSILETSDSDLLGTNIQLLEQELPSAIPSTRENSHCLRVLNGASDGVCSSVSG